MTADDPAQPHSALALLAGPGEGSAAAMAQWILSAAGPDLSNALGKLPAAIRQAAAGEVADAAAGLLDINLTDVLVAGWRDHHDLVTAARRTLADPGSTELVNLATHSITLTQSPYVSVLVDGRQLATVNLQLSLVFDVSAVRAKISSGKLTALQSGRCDITATLAIQDTDVITRQGQLELPGAISLRNGIRLLPATDYLAGGERTAASHDGQGRGEPTARTPMTSVQVRGEPMKTPWAVILCKFSDGDDEPLPRKYYEDLFTARETSSPWNMVRYFRDHSHGSLDLTGTRVFGWFKLRHSVADYNSLAGNARETLIQWARDAATAAGFDVTPFFSTVACTNLRGDIGATATGVVTQGPGTPFPSGLGQEMGHVYGLKHSRADGSDADYQDPWDIMSASSAFAAPDRKFHFIGPGLNAWNMRSRGWLDESRVWKGAGGSVDEIITLRPLVRRDLPGFLAADLPGGFLIEFRFREGWDAGMPRPAVLVHRFEDGHSYLMPANSGSHDLITGDSFGDAQPGPGPIPMLTPFARVDVLSIDDASRQATLRLQYHRPLHPDPEGQAIDPMYLMLSGHAYLNWVKQHHPHEPQIAEILTVLQAMTPAEQDAALNRATALVAYGRAVEAAIAEIRT